MNPTTAAERALCTLHRERLGPGAECPVCTTAEQVKTFARLAVRLADRLEQIERFYHSFAAAITLELNLSEIKLARCLVEREEHVHYYLSSCCGVGEGEIKGLCPRCRDWTGFDCDCGVSLEY